ncbi:hypothetical protein NKG94_02680 [Micromonospora sp. M12]
MACCVIAAAAQTSAAQAPTPDPQAYVKYYVVAAEYQGQPENLTEVAIRFLGSGDRSAEIYNLNAGRVQADGAGLTDPARLNRGWHLVLPWDAAGRVRYGQLPAARSRPGSRPRSPRRPRRPLRSPVRAHPGRAEERHRQHCRVHRHRRVEQSLELGAVAARGRRCLGAEPGQRGHGRGCRLRVDGKLAQLSGRVAVGADVTVGNGRVTPTASVPAPRWRASSPPAPAATRPGRHGARRHDPAHPGGRPLREQPGHGRRERHRGGGQRGRLGRRAGLPRRPGRPHGCGFRRHRAEPRRGRGGGAPTKPVTVPSAGERSATGALLLAGVSVPTASSPRSTSRKRWRSSPRASTWRASGSTAPAC